MADIVQIDPQAATEVIRKTESDVMNALGVHRLSDFVRRAVLTSVLGEGQEREHALSLVHAITRPADTGPKAMNAVGYDTAPDKAAYR